MSYERLWIIKLQSDHLVSQKIMGYERVLLYYTKKINGYDLWLICLKGPAHLWLE